MLPLIRRRMYFTLLTRVVESRVAVTDDVERFVGHYFACQQDIIFSRNIMYE